MKTLSQVKKENPQYKQLINNVIKQLGGWDDEETPNTIEAINSHGIDGGYGGFIYHSDTIKFFNDNRKDIIKMAEALANELGEGGFLELIQGFNCLSHNRKPEYTQTQIAAAIYEADDENETAIKNALSWFAGEEVCRMFEN